MKSGFRYSFNPVMLLLSIFFFSGFSGLSLWQVNRVFEKQEKSELIEQANQGAAVDINAASDEKVLSHLFYKATVRGMFHSEQCFFVENVVRNSQPGLYTYCLFQPDLDKRWLLVNMGWLKQTSNRLNYPEYQVNTAINQIEGMISTPRSRPVVVAQPGKPNSENEKLWTYFDFESLKQQTGFAFYPIELRLITGVDNQLERDWPEFEPKIGMHIGYAIHWGVFALVTLGLFIKFNFSKQK